MSIPKEFWDFDKRWDELGFQISRILRNKFGKACSGEEEDILDFGFTAIDMSTRFRHLKEESLNYVNRIRKEKHPEDVESLTDWDTV